MPKATKRALSLGASIPNTTELGTIEHLSNRALFFSAMGENSIPGSLCAFMPAICEKAILTVSPNFSVLSQRTVNISVKTR